MTDPIARYLEWFGHALDNDVPLPEAAALSTATPDGKPSSRMVLVKIVSQAGFVFFTNYGSRKARDLDANPAAALLWHWTTLERQIRVEGSVERISAEESEAYFQTRPLGSRIGAWASHQSRELASRADLEAEVRRYTEKFGEDVPLPPFWGGYRLKPDLIEFWQGRPDRLHDRTEYTRSGTAWVSRLLNP